MRYKLLKYIESQDSIDIGSVFDTNESGVVELDNGLYIPVKLLIDQGFIEEVKETPKPRWRVGDYAVDNESRFIKIFSVSKKSDMITYNEVCVGGWFGIPEQDLRDPTQEELKIYFR